MKHTYLWTTTILSCLLLAVGMLAAAEYPTSRVVFLETYLNGQNSLTETNPAQTVALDIPNNELFEVRFYVVLETEGKPPNQIEAWTSIINPVYSGFSENGSAGIQQGTSWAAEAQTRLILDLSGKIRSTVLREGDIIFRLSCGENTILIISALKGANAGSNAVLKTVENIFVGPHSIIFYSAASCLVLTAFVVRRRFKPIKDRNK